MYKYFSCLCGIRFEKDWVRIPSEIFYYFNDMKMILNGFCIPLIPEQGKIQEEEPE
jgi:hypothetical protein